MHEKPSRHDQEDSRNEDDVIACINTSMVDTSMVSSSRLTLAIVDGDEN